MLEVRNGSWLFKGADEASFSDAGFDDGSWTTVTVPHDWRDPPASYTNGTGSVGWYRRHLATPTAAQIKAAQAGTLQLALGTVANQAEVWINGKEVGSTGRAEHVNTGCEVSGNPRHPRTRARNAVEASPASLLRDGDARRATCSTAASRYRPAC